MTTCRVCGKLTLTRTSVIRRSKLNDNAIATELKQKKILFKQGFQCLLLANSQSESVRYIICRICISIDLRYIDSYIKLSGRQGVCAHGMLRSKTYLKFLFQMNSNLMLFQRSFIDNVPQINKFISYII